MRAQRFEAGANSYAFAKNLACHCGAVIIERIQYAKFEAIDADSLGEFIVKLLLGDRGLRHAETAESSGRNEMRMHGAS